TADFVGIGRYEGTGNRFGWCPDEDDPPEPASGVGRVWLAAHACADGGLLIPSLSDRPVFHILVYGIAEDMFANPANATPGMFSAEAPLEGGTATFVDEHEGEEGCGSGGRTTITMTLQPGSPDE
ncbi:MAG: hypothetical protein M3423_05920, partial [Actinomycetota bacterium]|nr:hypothetical protein [Actinomycetota bacterium]